MKKSLFTTALMLVTVNAMASAVNGEELSKPLEPINLNNLDVVKSHGNVETLTSDTSSEVSAQVAQLLEKRVVKNSISDVFSIVSSGYSDMSVNNISLHHKFFGEYGLLTRTKILQSAGADQDSTNAITGSQASTLLSFCHTACHGACHFACHGARGWR